MRLVLLKYLVVALFVAAFGSLQHIDVVFPGSTLAYSSLTVPLVQQTNIHVQTIVAQIGCANTNIVQPLVVTHD